MYMAGADQVTKHPGTQRWTPSPRAASWCARLSVQAGENGTVLHQRDRIGARVHSTPPFCQSCFPQSLGSLLCSLPGLFPLLFCSPLLTALPVSRQLATQSLAAQEDRAESLKWLMCPAPQRSKSQAPDWLVGPRMRAGWVCWRQVGMSTSAGSLLSLSRSLAASRLCCRIGVGRADLVCAPPYS